MSDKFTVKARINTFQGIDSLTYSMQIVSIIKLKKILPYINNSKGLAQDLDTLFQLVSSADIELPRIKSTQKLIMVMTSNRGFCGEFNSELLKKLRKNYDLKAADNNFIIIGIKGRDSMPQKLFTNVSYVTLTDKDTINTVKLNDLVTKLITSIAAGEYAAIEIMFNSFESIMRRNTINKRLYPQEKQIKDSGRAGRFIFEPTLNIDIYYHYLKVYLASTLYYHLMESAAGELGARFIMMKGATDSCKTMIHDLILELNKIRQASITKDLSEVVSGFKVLTERG